MKTIEYYVVKINKYTISGGQVDEVVYYRNRLTFSMVIKWKWYFEYLAALLKVKYPRLKIEVVISAQELLQGGDYIKEKTKNLLKAKKGQLKKLNNSQIDDDIFGFTKQSITAKKEKIKSEIEALERGEFNYYVPVEYINRMRNHRTKQINQII